MVVEKEGGSMEEESLKRKERLLNLRKRAAERDGDKEDDKSDSSIKPLFRSYAPQDKSLGDTSTEKDTYVNYIEEEVKEQLESIATPIITEEVDIVNLAPRKADWDLKRDVARKLAKLERITQKAVAELIRERMQNNPEEIFQAVNVSTATLHKDQKSF